MQSLKRILPLLKPYWKSAGLAMMMLLLLVVAELLIPLQIQHIIDDGVTAGDMGMVVQISLIMVGLALLSLILSIGNTIFSVRVSEAFAADLRGATYYQVQDFSFGNLDTFQTGELLVRLTSDVNMVKRLVMMAMQLVLRAPLMVIGSLVMLIITSPTLALILVVMLPVTVGIIWWFSIKIRPMFQLIQQRLERLNTVLQENLAGVRVVKAFVRANFENQRFDQANTNLMDQSIIVFRIIAVLIPTMILILNLGVVAIIWFGGNLAINDQLTNGEIVAFINYLLTTMVPVLMMGMIIPMVASGEASAKRILEVMDTKPTVPDQPVARHLNTSQIKGRVAFENVSFDYDGVDGVYEAALKQISFVAEPGETVAILGATGSGKSTLINLIPRFYDVTEGRVTIDGVDARDLSQASLRAEIGIALQEAILFRGTIRDNIKYGRPQATDEDVVAAAKSAQAHDFIMEKPDGYDTRVGQRGANFSGGQKQRLAIARALCVLPQILILDDSTSAIDVETETKIQAALQTIMQDRTTFVVAQRISTVLTADKIIVLDKGQVSAMGTHPELLANSPIYQEIYQSQLGNGLLNGNGRNHYELETV